MARARDLSAGHRKEEVPRPFAVLTPVPDAYAVASLWTLPLQLQLQADEGTLGQHEARLRRKEFMRAEPTCVLPNRDEVTPEPTPREDEDESSVMSDESPSG